MKRFLIVAFLHHIWVASVVTQSKNQLSRVGKAEVPNLSSQFFDLTDLIRGLLQDKISDENFNSHLKLIFANETSLRNNSNVLSITGLYDTGCIMLDNCKTKITEVIATVKNAIGERIDMILILSVRLDIYNKSYHEEKENSLKIENVTDFKYLFLFQLPEEIECDNMEDMDPSAWKNMLGPKNGNWRNQMGASEFYGFGYDERLIGCYEVKTAISLAGFTVVYISFGKTAGVPETFGVFQNQIGSLYRQNKEFIKNIPVLSTFYINSLKRTFYFPKSESLGDSRHQHLLREYGSRWLAESNNDTGLILPIPENTTDMDDAKFSVIPYLGPSNGWVFPSALLAITQEFSSMIFSHSHLKAFYENAAGLYQNLNKKPSNDFRLEAILDYSYRWTLDKNVNTWEALELVLNQWRWQSVVYPLKNIVLKTLLFKIGYTEAGNFQAFVDIDFASHIVHNYQIGCNISVKVFSQVSPSTVVEVCKNISGSLYILNSEVVLGNISEMGTGYNYHYPNIIRKQLEHIKSIRNDILIQHPNATVYLTLSLLSNYPEDEDNTVFCNPSIFSVNEYYEAILNWAKFSDFPVILKAATDEFDASVFKGWLSYLKPVGWAKALVTLVPLFVMRNYPQDINGWNTDPCIDQVHDGERPDTRLNFFHNSYIRAIFHSDKMEDKHKIDVEEYEILLQFILHKFKSVEVALNNNWRNIVAAIKNLATRGLVEPTKEIFFTFPPIFGEGLDIHRQLEPSIVREFIEKIVEEKLPNAMGIHIDVSTSLMNMIENKKLSEPYHDMELWKSLRRDGNPKFNLEMGILLNQHACMATLKYMAFGEISDNFMRLMNATNYIVYSDKLNLAAEDNVKSLAAIFDTHLYIKRRIQDIWKHLKIYFKIDVDVLLADPATMDRYLKLISHIKKFGEAYNINYFIVEAFDGTLQKNGWWEIQNFTDLTLLDTYIEKDSAYSTRNSWRPSLPKNDDFVTNTINTSDSKLIAIAVPAVSIIFLVLCTISCYFYVGYYKASRYLSKDEVKEFLNGRRLATQDNGRNECKDLNWTADFLKFDAEYELSILELNIDTRKILGFGNFGTVYKGFVKGKPAAIKRPNNDCDKNTFKSVLSEVKVLCYIGAHPNVVGFLGAYIKEIDKGILCIAMEFCSNGSLESFLKQLRRELFTGEDRSGSDSISNVELGLHLYDLHRFASEISDGMNYIGSRKVVHADLSARNVLLDENKTCKIGDFGLSRKLYENEKYVKKSEEPLPWKWMAYESLRNNEFTVKSDVWSFGITLWEIYSLGSTPFGGLAWSPNCANLVQEGLRLVAPQFASEIIYMRMQECWSLDPVKRPAFAELSEFFRGLCNDQYALLN